MIDPIEQQQNNPTRRRRQRPKSIIISLVALTTISYQLFNESTTITNNYDDRRRLNNDKEMPWKGNNWSKASPQQLDTPLPMNKRQQRRLRRAQKQALKTKISTPQEVKEHKQRHRKMLTTTEEGYSLGTRRMSDIIEKHYGHRKMFNGAADKYPSDPHIDECVGKPLEECRQIVNSYVTARPSQFNNQTSLILDYRKIREQTDPGYYKIVLLTDKSGTKLSGIFDDGVVFYPWPWMVNGIQTTIGPWDCDNLSPEECCTFVQGEVPLPDDSGNFLACFVEEPVGGPKNPKREDRAIAIVDSDLVVVRAPIAH